MHYEASNYYLMQILDLVSLFSLLGTYGFYKGLYIVYWVDPKGWLKNQWQTTTFKIRITPPPAQGGKWWCLMTRWVVGSGLMMTWSKNIQEKKNFSSDWFFFSGKMNQNYYVACSFFFNKNKPCLILALFIKERKKILIGGWVWGNDDVIIKVGIGNDDVWW